ncbi:MAG: hypothetical protein JOZ51_10335 [Chloroflexi bacterium]|nr:hypothetical protein [Chloroflexota bacterium]
MHTFLNRSFLTKLVLGLTLLTLSSLTVAVQAMTAVQNDAAIVTKFIDEARKFGLAFKPEDVEVRHTPEGTTATAILNAPWTEDAVAKGLDVGFAYVASSGSEPVPNGFYKLHLKDDAATQTLSFLDQYNKPVAVMKGSKPVTTTASGSISGLFVRLPDLAFWEEVVPGESMKPVLHLNYSYKYPTPTPRVPPLGQ